VDYQLSINGKQHLVEAAGCETLLEILRERLALRGAKRGCNQGVCGACTVLIDGRAVRSCLSLVAACTDQQILTVEGISKEGELSPLQNAVVETGAVQCGFCTSGMLLSLTALFDLNPSPTVEEIRHGLSGNLCRCTGYKKIVDAACLVAASQTVSDQ
jgi:carbon-monoxide dehydrogenase small subunit